MNVTKIFIGIGMTCLIILFYSWSGMKGAIGTLLGISLMSYLFISGNPLFIYMAEKMSSKEKAKVIRNELIK